MGTGNPSSVVRMMVALAVALWCGVSAAPRADAEAPAVTIGAILPLTGSSAAFGQAGRAAMELAIEELPPQDRARIKLVIEDDGLVANRSVAAGRKLLDIDRADILITWSSSTALSLVGITESRSVPHIAIASDPAVSRNRRYAFTYWALPEDEARTLYGYLAQQKLKRIAILAVTHNGLLANRTALEELSAQQKNVEIVISEEVPDSLFDFRSVLDRMKRRGAFDAFLPIFFPGQLAPAVKQAREAGIRVPIVGFETFEDANEIAAAGGRFGGVVFATGADPTPDFTRAFLKKLPHGSLYTASNCYDAVMLVAHATRSGKSPDEVVAFLRSIKDYLAASGRVSATSDNRFLLPTTLKTINDKGEVVALKEP
jgi:branched-chain amino acid transport system substrate-binding protein